MTTQQTQHVTDDAQAPVSNDIPTITLPQSELSGRKVRDHFTEASESPVKPPRVGHSFGKI